MLFKPELIEKILAGEKTQTRRIVGEREFQIPGGVEPKILAVYIEDGVRDNRHKLKWRVGRTYAICPGRGKTGVARIKITEIRRQNLREISIPDAEAEGVYCGDERYADVSNFIALWNSINTRPGIRWQDNPEVWAISFELA